MLSVPYMTFCEHFGCRHDFYKLSLDNDFYNYNDNTSIEIKNNRKKHLIYHAEPSLEFVHFISNIGGLFGLYFGLSFIDISDILKSITRRIGFYLQRIIFYQKIKALILYLKLSQIKILKIIKRITKLPWKLIFIIVSSAFFVSQMFDLIIDYFQFSTKISFEFIDYQQKNQKISINEFPAITVCTEHMFEKAFFDKYYIYFNEGKFLFPKHPTVGDKRARENCWLQRFYNEYGIILKTTNDNILSFLNNHCKHNFQNEDVFRFLSKYFDINTVEEYHQVIRRIEDKHIYGLNGTLDLLDFYVNHHNCWTLYEPNIKCQDLKPTIKMLSPFGKCHTYLMGENNNDTFVDKVQVLTGDARGELRSYLKRTLILHSTNHLPIWTSNRFSVTDIQFKQENILL